MQAAVHPSHIARLPLSMRNAGELAFETSWSVQALRGRAVADHHGLAGSSWPLTVSGSASGHGRSP